MDLEWFKFDPGWLKQISYDGTTVACVNAKNEIYAVDLPDLHVSPSWRRLNGWLSYIVVRGEDIFGVNPNGEVYWGRNNGTNNPGWVRIPGWLKQISFDGNQLAGVNGKDEIYVADRDLRSNPNWRRVPGNLKHVVINGDTLLGVNSKDEIYTGRATGDPDWLHIQGWLMQISISEDGSRIAGVNALNEVWAAEITNIRENPKWYRVAGWLKYVDCYGSLLYGTNGKDEGYFSNPYTVDNIVYVPDIYPGTTYIFDPPTIIYL